MTEVTLYYARSQLLEGEYHFVAAEVDGEPVEGFRSAIVHCEEHDPPDLCVKPLTAFTPSSTLWVELVTDTTMWRIAADRVVWVRSEPHHKLLLERMTP